MHTSSIVIIEGNTILGEMSTPKTVATIWGEEQEGGKGRIYTESGTRGSICPAKKEIMPLATS